MASSLDSYCGMLITDSFVMLNYPKTGSSFVRNVIKEIHQCRLIERSVPRKIADRLGITSRPFLKELMLPNIWVKGVHLHLNQHGSYCQIPVEYRDREIVTVVRNPYDRLLSAYEYRWWVDNPPINNDLLATHFPHFPDLSLDEYIRLGHLGMVHGRLDGKEPSASIGSQTVQFIQMFFADPPATLNQLTDEYIDSGRILEDMPPITLLRQEHLRDDLVTLLRRHGFSDEEVALVRGRERVNVTADRERNRNDLWTNEVLQYIHSKERAVFSILRSRGIEYHPPLLTALK